jgi:hypothetical protein
MEAEIGRITVQGHPEKKNYVGGVDKRILA